MTSAREVMTVDVQTLGEEDTAMTAARRMAQLGIGSLPVCGADERLVGVVTDRDIVVDVVARGASPDEVAVGNLVSREAVTIGADDSLEEARRTMAEHQVRRLPVIDGRRLVGIISMADVARESPEPATGRTERAVTE